MGNPVTSVTRGIFEAQEQGNTRSTDGQPLVMEP
jgi:hypothetical protein